MPAFDLIDVAAAALASAGLGSVRTTLPSSSECPEPTVLQMAESGPQERYMDGTVSGPLAVTVIVKRESERAAQDDCAAAASALSRADLASANGSYTLDGSVVGVPRPIQWDESGFWVWAVDVEADTTRREF